jgi:hypothetical protein
MWLLLFKMMFTCRVLQLLVFCDVTRGHGWALDQQGEGGAAINRGRLVQLLVYLARDEEADYKRRAVSVLLQ